MASLGNLFKQQAAMATATEGSAPSTTAPATSAASTTTTTAPATATTPMMTTTTAAPAVATPATAAAPSSSTMASTGMPLPIPHSMTSPKKKRKVRVVRKPMIRKNKRLLQPALISMMFGFGDAKEPYEQTVDLMEDIVTSYIDDVIQYAFRTADRAGITPFEAIMMLVRRDKKKHVRIADLLMAKKDIEDLRQEHHKSYSTKAAAS
ncbi:hypothetical protein PTSG_03418 [Salpingoeca rosetta]|uniref:Transcription initiation factor TFIID subunit 13 n=1 Tax=Salpingoeca rosetta (strain ATCC 50818 / BSB-021) TaxID=946362 RepID=F2U552_SALR5|nr:uncharacterized protein PTSG_03418 [Salpingoeca rosetta]EGD82768.1 hypothetical protein PTSG_03418 [Salpingoeca rosetta]|eukprot:XP_004996004.1 hypothetical protein PTSG_03418 [Salpingoeca rosetta]